MFPLRPPMALARVPRAPYGPDFCEAILVIPPPEGGVWFGLGQGLCRTPWPTVSTRLCADTTGLG